MEANSSFFLGTCVEIIFETCRGISRRFELVWGMRAAQEGQFRFRIFVGNNEVSTNFCFFFGGYEPADLSIKAGATGRIEN